MDRKHLRGAISEEYAKIWLLNQGLEVFENIACWGKADLISRNPTTGELVCWDVTTEYRYPETPDWWKEVNNGVRYLMVTREGEVIYPTEGQL